jgi:hypothetical protein
VLAVHEAANLVLRHAHHAPNESFWHRWFEKPDERHFADEVRAFIARLDHLLDVPPQMLTRDDLAVVGQLSDSVVKCIEAFINDSAATAGGAAAALTPAVYLIRARYEELFKRGASKAP